MKPRVGNYSMTMTPPGSGYSATTPYYAGNGKGTLVTTVADSIVRDANECLLNVVHVSHVSAATSTLEIYHGDGTLAWNIVGGSSSHASSEFTWPDGLLLTGAWYIEFANTPEATEMWSLGFKIDS